MQKMACETTRQKKNKAEVTKLLKKPKPLKEDMRVGQRDKRLGSHEISF